MPPIKLLRKDSLKSPSHKGRLNEFTSVPRNFHNNYSSRVTSERETWFIKLSKRFVIRREFIVSLMAASDGCEHMWKVFSAVFVRKWSSSTFQAQLLCVPAVRRAVYRKFSMLCQFCKRTRDWLLWICAAISVSAQSWLFSSIKSLKNDNRVETEEFLSHRNRNRLDHLARHREDDGALSVAWNSISEWVFIAASEQEHVQLINARFFVPTACDVRLCARRECTFHFYRTHRIGTFCNHNKQTQLGASILLNDP